MSQKFRKQDTNKHGKNRIKNDIHQVLHKELFLLTF